MQKQKYNSEFHKRRSIRLKGYDYSDPGNYFVTICTYNREYLFGEIIEGEMKLNELGEIIQGCWYGLPSHYNNINLDEFIIMPNHIHCIISILVDEFSRRAGLKPAPTEKRYKLSEIIRGLKTFSARKINELNDTKGNPVWQRDYYEHIIDTEKELEEIRDYILSNPNMWDRDRNNMNNTKLR